jgi:hypothetical protein
MTLEQALREDTGVRLDLDRRWARRRLAEPLWKRTVGIYEASLHHDYSTWRWEISWQSEPEINGWELLDQGAAASLREALAQANEALEVADAVRRLGVK